ncbi:MAG: hypothetical protein IH585_02115, partial [Anaerolineaceae bacterium]|nr:hypothetical protein [Anaerolineaceae bacterium]
MPFSSRILKQPLALLITLALIILVAFLAPVEKTIGANIRLIYVHAAWVWTGKFAFGLSALAGLLALLLSSKGRMVHISRSIAYSALFFWLTYLPMSLIVMQVNWGGFFFDEPRWRVPFLLGIIAVLLQGALWAFNNNRLTALGNLAFGIALWWQLGGVENILHPDNTIGTSESNAIMGSYTLILILTIFLGAQLILWIYEQRHPIL